MTRQNSKIKFFIFAALILGGGYILSQTDSLVGMAYNFIGTAGNIALPGNTVVKINDVNIPVEVVTTIGAMQKGLSGRSSLDQNKGMLFLFAKPDYYRFWMHKMNFPIDIIWIRDERIVGITSNIQADFNPLKPKTYAPPTPVNSALEVNAGFTKAYDISIGDYARLGNF